MSHILRAGLKSTRTIVAVVLLLFAGAAQMTPVTAVARTQTPKLNVMGAVIQDCTLSTSPVSFPSIGVGYLHSPGKTVLAQSSLSVHCTKGATVQIVMNAGLYGSKAGSQFGSRSMKSSPGNSYLGYDLCHDSGCASIWSPQGYNYVSPSDAGPALALWGRIKTGQQVDTGNYSDVVTVTVSF